MEKEKTKGCFVAFVLLSEGQWDKQQFIHDFKEDWGITLTDDNDNGDEDVLVEIFDNMTLAIAIMPGPVPNGEAEHYAQGNYLWKDATETAQQHKAHILVSVTGDQSDLFERAKLFTKATASCLKQPNATAVYTDGMVFQPEFYREIASSLQEDELPLMDWVWFGVYRTQKGTPGIYTYGLRKFGKEEMEVYANADLSDIRDFLLDIVSYILSEDVTLQDGETIGFSEEQKLSITLSEGIAIDGMTLKLEYPKE
ncbi:DUF4261 domain-containing protein [Phocaeicola coprophilus]|uniref:DUF4261 domain-containing protein n=1 Tax=Phocaeicola coprophilus TaxID=387090 RepID=UPI00399627CD